MLSFFRSETPLFQVPLEPKHWCVLNHIHSHPAPESPSDMGMVNALTSLGFGRRKGVVCDQSYGDELNVVPARDMTIPRSFSSEKTPEGSLISVTLY